MTTNVSYTDIETEFRRSTVLYMLNSYAESCEAYFFYLGNIYLNIVIYSQFSSTDHLYIKTTCLTTLYKFQKYTFHVIKSAYKDHLCISLLGPPMVPRVVLI